MDLRKIGNWNLIQLAQDKVRLRAFVSMVMNFVFHKESRLLFDKLRDYHLFKEYHAPLKFSYSNGIDIYRPTVDLVKNLYLKINT
jgi:hypothetical protein